MSVTTFEKKLCSFAPWNILSPALCDGIMWTNSADLSVSQTSFERMIN